MVVSKMTKLTKQQAGYVLHANSERLRKGTGGCKNCKYFHPTTKTCNIVKGVIQPTAGCKYFKRG